VKKEQFFKVFECGIKEQAKCSADGEGKEKDAENEKKGKTEQAEKKEKKETKEQKEKKDRQCFVDFQHRLRELC